jgi:hypothetical protein
MKAHVKILLIISILCSAGVMQAQTNDSSDASNSDNSNKVRHGGAPGSTASYTVHDGEVRPVVNGKMKGNNGGTGSSGTAQAPNASAANTGAQPTGADSVTTDGSLPAPVGNNSPDAATASNCHFCWGWLGCWVCWDWAA